MARGRGGKKRGVGRGRKKRKENKNKDQRRTRTNVRAKLRTYPAAIGEDCAGTRAQEGAALLVDVARLNETSKSKADAGPHPKRAPARAIRC